MFEWVKGNAYTMLVTLYPNNFTLNNVAAAYSMVLYRARPGRTESCDPPRDQARGRFKTHPAGAAA